MFDVPIAMKPVYINMTINFETLQIADLLNHLSWNVQSLNWLFGYGWVSPVISHGKITPVHWVWFPKTNSNRISVALYNSINNKACYNTNWDGWSVIWKLNVAPRGKTFIWLLLHVKVQIYDFLYNLHMDPPDHCVFCGLVLETVDHLFRDCPKSRIIWNWVEFMTSFKINLYDHITSGEWLDISSKW